MNLSLAVVICRQFYLKQRHIVGWWTKCWRRRRKPSMLSFALHSHFICIMYLGHVTSGKSAGGCSMAWTAARTYMLDLCFALTVAKELDRHCEYVGQHEMWQCLGSMQGLQDRHGQSVRCPLVPLPRCKSIGSCLCRKLCCQSC